MRKIIGMRTFKTFVSVFICMYLGQVLNRDPEYAAFAAIMCMQPNVEESINQGIDRVIGTSIGCMVAIVMVLFIDTPYVIAIKSLYMAFGIMPVIALCNKVNHPSSSSIASIVYVIIMLGAGITDNNFVYAINRSLDTIVGIIVTVVVNKSIQNPSKDTIKRVQTNFNYKHSRMLLDKMKNVISVKK